MKHRISPLPTLSLLLTFLAATPAHSQAPAGPNRPVGVPDGYVITPSGYFHPSCIRQVAEGDTLLEDGPAIQHADGTIENIPACEYPHYTARGEIAIEGSTESGPLKQNWIEDAEATTGNSIGELTAIWTVPPAPTSNDNQAVGFFPGLEQYPGSPILQPVLAWVASAKVWSIFGENCCPSGNDFKSSPIIVSSGDTIKGFIRQTCKAGTQSCPTWKVTAIDVQLGKNGSTTLPTKSYGYTFNWAFAGALEVINLVQCSDYPPSGQLTFSGLALYDYNFIKIPSPGWKIVDDSKGVTPQCGYVGPSPAANQVTLDYLPTVLLNPYGTVQVSKTPPPYSTVVVDDKQGHLVAPADVTVTLLRQVISQCRGVIFSRNDTVVISQGQMTGTFSDYAGRDPSCNTLPITTQWTITGAVLAPNVNLSLKTVPPKQLTLSAVF